MWNAANKGLFAQGPADGLLGSLWEFPGGKQEPGETLPQCLERELGEELGIRVEVGSLLLTVKHAFTHFKIRLHAFDSRYVDEPPQTLKCPYRRWVRVDETAHFAFVVT